MSKIFKMSSLLGLVIMANSSDLKAEASRYMTPADFEKLDAQVQRVAKENNLSVSRNLYSDDSSSVDNAHENAKTLMTAMSAYGNLKKLRKNCGIESSVLSKIEKGITTLSIRSASSTRFREANGNSKYAEYIPATKTLFFDPTYYRESLIARDPRMTAINLYLRDFENSPKSDGEILIMKEISHSLAKCLINDPDSLVKNTSTIDNDMKVLNNSRGNFKGSSVESSTQKPIETQGR